MKIHFIGLSCFLIENQAGFRILVDPFNDAPEWQLGPNFPKTFLGKLFGTNVVLMSEPDADHAFAPGGWLQHAPPTAPNSNPFPHLDLRGTVIYEYNGDVNIAWHYTVDGLRLAHFADNAHLLTDEQLTEIGSPDVIFISPPKTDDRQANDIVRQNIVALKPKLIFWAHHLAPKNLPTDESTEVLRTFFKTYFKTNASANKRYENESSFLELCYVLENALILNKEYSGIVLNKPSLEVDRERIDQAMGNPKSYLFCSMLAQSSNE